KRMRENTRTNVSARVAKNRKLDPIMKVECGNILKELMNHPAGWVFSEPVDPVKLQIPDYFSIVSKPMDLGTVKGKLDIYSCADEFFDDVKLTFANAILYNPGWNRVHHLAKQLDSLFYKRWKKFEADRKRKKDSDHTQYNSTPAASCASVANVQKRKKDSVDDCVGKQKQKDSAAASIIMSASNVEEMSLKISLRAATLKSRFAETILKAKYELQQHKGSTEERRFESEEERVKERERIEEEYRAAQKEDLKTRRKIERMALEQMEKSVST
ncbi:hypothetical protein MIMGU_mgv1a019775mg, partial [Erythranthe guttata]